MLIRPKGNLRWNFPERSIHFLSHIICKDAGTLNPLDQSLFAAGLHYQNTLNDLPRTCAFTRRKRPSLSLRLVLEGGGAYQDVLGVEALVCLNDMLRVWLEV